MQKNDFVYLKRETNEKSAGKRGTRTTNKTVHHLHTATRRKDRKAAESPPQNVHCTYILKYIEPPEPPVLCRSILSGTGRVPSSEQCGFCLVAKGAGNTSQ
ncbi:hypothetical protein ACMFMG_001791 [Clarireedia jacksonii]